MARIRWFILLVALPALLMSALVACDGDDGSDSGNGDADVTEVVEPLPTDADGEGADGGDAAVQLEVTGVNIAFEPDTLVAPVGQSFTVAFANADSGISHNFAIFASEADATGGSDPIAKTEVAAGPDTQTLEVAALGADNYFVWCQVHTASMTATLTVE